MALELLDWKKIENTTPFSFRIILTRGSSYPSAQPFFKKWNSIWVISCAPNLLSRGTAGLFFSVHIFICRYVPDAYQHPRWFEQGCLLDALLVIRESSSHPRKPIPAQHLEGEFPSCFVADRYVLELPKGIVSYQGKCDDVRSTMNWLSRGVHVGTDRERLSAGVCFQECVVFCSQRKWIFRKWTLTRCYSMYTPYNLAMTYEK